MSKNRIVASRVREYIKDYFKSTGIKQEFLAKEMGYTPRRLSLLINGKAVMSIDDLVNISKYFREPVSRFLENELAEEAG